MKMKKRKTLSIIIVMSIIITAMSTSGIFVESATGVIDASAWSIVGTGVTIENVAEGTKVTIVGSNSTAGVKLKSYVNVDVFGLIVDYSSWVGKWPSNVTPLSWALKSTVDGRGFETQVLPRDAGGHIWGYMDSNSNPHLFSFNQPAAPTCVDVGIKKDTSNGEYYYYIDRNGGEGKKLTSEGANPYGWTPAFAESINDATSKNIGDIFSYNYATLELHAFVVSGATVSFTIKQVDGICDPLTNPVDVMTNLKVDIESHDMVPSVNWSGAMAIDDSDFCMQGPDPSVVHPGNNYSSAKALVVPNDGLLSVVNISQDNAFVQKAFAPIGEVDGVKFMMIHSRGENNTVLKARIYSGAASSYVSPDADGWYPVSSSRLDIRFDNLSVKANDKIYFIINKGANNAGDTTYLLINGINLRKQDNTVVSIMNSLSGFSQTQGANGWRYEAVKITPRALQTDCTLSGNSVNGKCVPLYSTVYLPFGTTSAEVTATPTSQFAYPVVSGNTTLVPGNNHVPIVIHAENGSIGNYALNLYVRAVSISNYSVTEAGGITNITPGLTVKGFLDGGVTVSSGSELIFKNNGATLALTDKVTTGTTAEVYVGGAKTTESYNLVIYGDVSCKGIIDLDDIVLIRNYLLDTQPMNNALQLAGDLYGEGDISLNDLVGVMASVSASGSINQNPGLKMANQYNLEQYVAPYWKGNTVYNESLMFVSNQNGSIDSAPLMYQPDKIISIRNSQLTKTYVEGVDWKLENGRIKVLPGSSIPVIAYSDYYMPSPIPNQSFPCTKGGYIIFTSGLYFLNNQIAVTYKHSQTWGGPVPSNKAAQLPKTLSKLQNNQPVKILFYGDSITTGASSSTYEAVAPYAPTWMDMFTNNLKAQFHNNNVTSVNTAVGGKLSEWGAQNAQIKGADQHPDLAVIAFGMNDTNVPLNTFKANIQSIMDTIRSKNPNCEFILVATMLPNSEVTGFFGNQINFSSVLSQLETTGVAMANVTEAHQYILSKKLYRDMTGNNVNHPNDFSARIYAQTISALLVNN